MKIEFDTTSDVEMELMRRMFGPAANFKYQYQDKPLADFDDPEPPAVTPNNPVELGTLRDDNTPLVDPVPVPDAEKQDAAAPSSELDGAGMPWDARIHSGGKTKTAKGVWKLRRGLDQVFVDQVKAELMGAMSPAPVVVPDVTPAADVPPAADAPLDWAAVMSRVAASVNAGTYNNVAEAQYLAANSIEGMHLLIQRPDLYAGFLTAVGA